MNGKGSKRSWLIVKNDEPKLKRWYAEAPLSKILFDDRIKTFRAAESYDEAELRELKASLNPVGGVSLLNPPHAVLDEEADALRVLAGSRRVAALKALTAPDKDGNRVLAEDAQIPIYVYYESDRQQALRLAMTDNAFRRDFDDVEKLRAIEEMDRVGVQLDEIASSIGTSKDTVKRYLAIARHNALRESLDDGILPYSRLAQIGALLEKSPDLSAPVAETLTDWRRQAEQDREDYLQKCEQAGKRPESTKRRLSGWLPPELFAGWLADLAKGQKPTGRLVQKKVRVEISEKAAEVDGVRIDLRNASVAELADAAIAYRHAAEQLEQAIGKVRSGAVSKIDFRQSAFYRQRFQQLTGEALPEELPPEDDPEEAIPAGSEGGDEGDSEVGSEDQAQP